MICDKLTTRRSGPVRDVSHSYHVCRRTSSQCSPVLVDQQSEIHNCPGKQGRWTDPEQLLLTAGCRFPWITSSEPHSSNYVKKQMQSIYLTVSCRQQRCLDRASVHGVKPLVNSVDKPRSSFGLFWHYVNSHAKLDTVCCGSRTDWFSKQFLTLLSRCGVWSTADAGHCNMIYEDAQLHVQSWLLSI